jgi:hypothetical protein
MPRRNRRARSSTTSPRPPHPLTPAQLHSLHALASDHLARHALCQEHAPADRIAMTASEDAETGVRFVSVGTDLDERAVRLSRRAKTSDAGVRVDR